MIKLQKRRIHLLVLTAFILSLSTGTVQANEYHIKPMKQKLNKQFQYKPKNIFQQLAIPLEYIKEQEDKKFKEFHKQENIKYWQWRNEQIRQEQLKKQQEEKNQWVTVIATAYTSDGQECGKSEGDGITASGRKVSIDRGTIAAPYDIPMFSHIYIPALNRTFIVEDRGNKNYIKWDDGKMRIDIYMNTKEEALSFGVKEFKAKLINNK